MVYEVMQHVNNFFPADHGTLATYSIEAGQIDLPFVKNGQWYMISGSNYNDGVWKYPEPLYDEVFYGTVTPLAPPHAFLQLCKEISEWEAQNGSKAQSPYQSESFGGYSYTRATGINGSALTWRDTFRSRLNDWRKV